MVISLVFHSDVRILVRLTIAVVMLSGSILYLVIAVRLHVFGREVEKPPTGMVLQLYHFRRLYAQ